MRHALVRYCLVGVVNTTLSLALDVALLAVAVPVALAAAVAFGAGAVSGYELNRRVTFGARRSARGAVSYGVIAVAGLALQGMLVAQVAAAGMGPLPAYVTVLPVVTAATFLANRAVTFRAARPPATAGVRAP